MSRCTKHKQRIVFENTGFIYIKQWMWKLFLNPKYNLYVRKQVKDLIHSRVASSLKFEQRAILLKAYITWVFLCICCEDVS